MTSVETKTSVEKEQINKRVTILGYYGAGNTGDEAILMGMLQELRQRGITDITVLSRDPALTTRQHQVKAVYTGRRTEGLANVYHTIRDSDLFILGGGGLLHDHTARVVPYWLSRVMMARIARTPVYFYAQGIGPIKRLFSRFLIRRLVNKVAYITVRDQPSIKLLGKLRITRPPIELTADPALLLAGEATGSQLLKNEPVMLYSERINIAICLRPWKNEIYKKNLVIALRKLAKEYKVHYTLIPFQYGQDEQISKQMQLALPNANLLEKEYSPTEMITILEQFDGIIGMRLHALILGALSNRPLFSLSYDDKVANFMERIDLNQYNYSIEELIQEENLAQEELAPKMPEPKPELKPELKQEANQTLEQALSQWLDNLSEISNNLKPRVQELQNQAKRNAEVALELLIINNYHIK